MTPLADALPAVAGAYVLDLRLVRPVTLAIATLASPRLAAGRYAYVGSARGAGGIRARVARHLRPGKRARWHIDHLTARARVAAVIARPGGAECELVAALCRHAEVRVPAPGFGSSDCARCPAHLLALPAGFDLEAGLDGIGQILTDC